MKINKTKVYPIREFTALLEQATPDDISYFAGAWVEWPDGEKVQARLVAEHIVLPATLNCERCNGPSDEQYLLGQCKDGWYIVVNDDGGIVADLREQSYVCDANADAGGEFVDNEDVGSGVPMIGLVFNIRMVPPDIMDTPNRSMRVKGDVDLHMPAPGDERLN